MFKRISWHPLSHKVFVLPKLNVKSFILHLIAKIYNLPITEKVLFDKERFQQQKLKVRKSKVGLL